VEPIAFAAHRQSTASRKAGRGYGAQGMGRRGSTPRGFGHEYGHGMSIQWRFGNSEILAQSMMELTDSRCTSYHHNVLIP